MFKGIEEALSEFERAYEKKQLGWHVLYGYDSFGRLNVYILDSHGNGWVLVMEPHFGLSARVERVNVGDLSKVDTIGFGFRKLSRDLFKRIVEEMRRYGRLTDATLKLIEKKAPIPKDQFKRGDSVLIGPYIYYPGIESLDERISRKLREKFEEEVRRRYGYIG